MPRRRIAVKLLVFLGDGMIDQLLERVVCNPKVMLGKPVVRGTRIPVEILLRMIAQRIPEEDILKEYPRLGPEDIQAALTYAARLVASEEVFPLTG